MKINSGKSHRLFSENNNVSGNINHRPIRSSRPSEWRCNQKAKCNYSIFTFSLSNNANLNNVHLFFDCILTKNTTTSQRLLTKLPKITKNRYIFNYFPSKFTW